VFVPLVLKPLLAGKQEPDPADVAAAAKVVAEQLPKLFDYLEQQIGERPFLVGGRLSIADLAVASPFVNLRHAGVAPERKRWPRLRAFLDRLHARPSFAKLIAEETPVFGKRSALITD
jgi:glutathione S-transferase